MVVGLSRDLGFRVMGIRHWEWVVGLSSAWGFVFWDNDLGHATQGSGHWRWVLAGGDVQPRGVVGGCAFKERGLSCFKNTNWSMLPKVQAAYNETRSIRRKFEFLPAVDFRNSLNLLSRC